MIRPFTYSFARRSYLARKPGKTTFLSDTGWTCGSKAMTASGSYSIRFVRAILDPRLFLNSKLLFSETDRGLPQSKEYFPFFFEP